MGCSTDFIQFVCEALSPLGEVRSRKMMGDYVICVNEKCVITACDNTAYVKKLPCIADLMADAECGCPYSEQKKHISSTSPTQIKHLKSLKHFGISSLIPKIRNNTMIETARLILRPWLESQAATLYKYASDPDIGPIAGWPPHTSIENSLEIIRTVFAAPETYAVILKETGEPIGSCGIMFSNSLHTADMQVGEVEIGYWIGKPYWGQGLIPEAVKALLNHSFNELHLKAVWCGYYDGNHKSRRVCEKCGFKYHHTNHGVISPLGDIRIEHFYKMTADDYSNLMR